MPTISDEEIETEARAMLRERIERTPWFRTRMTREQRQEAIEREVEMHWRLYVSDAVKRLLEGPGPREEMEPSPPRRYRVRSRRRSG